MAQAEHPEDRCEVCGQYNPTWFAPNDIWNRGNPKHSGILCPSCFAQRAEANGVNPTSWKFAPEDYIEPDLLKYITHLEKYKQHLPDCAKWVESYPANKCVEMVLDDSEPCTCGLEGGSQ